MLLTLLVALMPFMLLRMLALPMLLTVFMLPILMRLLSVVDVVNVANVVNGFHVGHDVEVANVEAFHAQAMCLVGELWHRARLLVAHATAPPTFDCAVGRKVHRALPSSHVLLPEPGGVGGVLRAAAAAGSAGG